MMRELLSDIDIPCKVLTSDRSVDESQILCMLDVFYRSIVDGLFTASVSTVPRQRRSFYKFWWDEELSLLKDNSIKTHQLWKSLGKPRSGEVFRNMQQAKYEYKSAIRNKKKLSKEHYTDELNDALIKKDTSSF